LGGELFYIRYDGGDVGDHISDAMREFNGNFTALGQLTDDSGVVRLGGSGIIKTINREVVASGISLATTTKKQTVTTIDPSLAVPVSYENCSASLSVVGYMSY
jgi:hypothetical protein